MGAAKRRTPRAWGSYDRPVVARSRARRQGLREGGVARRPAAPRVGPPSRAWRRARVPRAGRRELHARARPVARHHRRERRGEVDAAEDRRGRDASDARHRRGQRPRGRAAGARLRASIPTTRGSPTSSSRRRCSGSDPTRSRPSARRSSRSRTSASTSTIRSSTTRRAWWCAWASPSRPRCARTSSSPTKCWRSATSRSRRNASPGWRTISPTAARCCCARTACITSRSCADTPCGCATAASCNTGRRWT